METVTMETVTTETVTKETDALSVVNQLRDLASDPLNRRVIIQDQGCVPGLVLFLDHPNPQVVYSTLLALRSLSESSTNQQRLGAELGMMLSLHNVMEKSTTPGETKLLASELYHLLQEAGGGGGDPRPEEGHAHTHDHAHLGDHAPLDGHAPLGGRRRAQFFLGASNKRAKTVILHIQGLDDAARRSQCEEVLLKVRGVVSFTFQMNMKRCIVRMRADLKAEMNMKRCIVRMRADLKAEMNMKRCIVRMRADLKAEMNMKRCIVRMRADLKAEMNMKRCIVRMRADLKAEMNMKRCIVRMRADLKAEVLACAISSTEVMKAFQVVKGEDGEEVLVPLEENVSSQQNQKQNLPEYLPEDDSPSQEPHKAVRTLGSPPEGNRWLGAATNFLSRTFYW